MNKKLVALLIFACLVVSIFSAMSQAKASSRTLTVPTEYSTINSALQSAIDGDTIAVKSGTYNERLEINQAVTLRGEGANSTFINGNNAGTVILVKHDGVKISGFTVMYDLSPNEPKSLWMWSTRLAGIHLLSARDCVVENNKVMDCGGGIWLFDCAENTISGNTVYRNDYGIRVENSNGTTLTRNTALGNWAGITLLSSGGSKLVGNSMSANTENFAVMGEDRAFVNEMDSTNTVDGKPVCYWVGKSYQTVPYDAGFVALLDCVGITVQGLTLSKNHDGIVLVNCLNIVVADNTITQANTGIATQSTVGDILKNNNIRCSDGIKENGQGSTISNNHVTATNIGIGVTGNYHTVTSNYAEILNYNNGNMLQVIGSYNSVSQNWLNGTTYTASSLEGSKNIFYNNTMTNSYQLDVKSSDSIVAQNEVIAIWVWQGVSGTIICGNKLSTNGLGLGIGGNGNFFYANDVEGNIYGASISGNEQLSFNNTIYHNNFVNNREQVRNNKNLSNHWDYLGEGNFWSDYNGSDSNMDGIGDTPHQIRTEVFDLSAGGMAKIVTGTDSYPLMNPFDISSIKVELPQWNYTSPQTIAPIASSNPIIIKPTPTSPQAPTQIPQPGTTTNQNRAQQPQDFTAIAIVIAAPVIIACILAYIIYRRSAGKSYLH